MDNKKRIAALFSKQERVAQEWDLLRQNNLSIPQLLSSPAVETTEFLFLVNKFFRGINKFRFKDIKVFEVFKNGVFIENLIGIERPYGVLAVTVGRKTVSLVMPTDGITLVKNDYFRVYEKDGYSFTLYQLIKGKTTPICKMVDQKNADGGYTPKCIEML